MALDRFVTFPKERPSREQVCDALRGYLGVAGNVTWEDSSRFYVMLPGECSYPDPRAAPRERWIEVYVDDEQFDVITRQQDDFTNAVADGIARFFAQHWEGTVDMSSIPFEALQVSLVSRVEQALLDAMRTSVFEQLAPPAYVVGSVGLRPLGWNWNAKIDKDRTAVGACYSTRKEACLAAWRHFEEQLREALVAPPTKKLAKKKTRRRATTGRAPAWLTKRLNVLGARLVLVDEKKPELKPGMRTDGTPYVEPKRPKKATGLGGGWEKMLKCKPVKKAGKKKAKKKP